MLKRSRRALEKQVLHEKLEEQSSSAISGKIGQKGGLLVGRKFLLERDPEWRKNPEKKKIYIYLYSFLLEKVSKRRLKGIIKEEKRFLVLLEDPKRKIRVPYSGGKVIFSRRPGS